MAASGKTLACCQFLRMRRRMRSDSPKRTRMDSFWDRSDDQSAPALALVGAAHAAQDCPCEPCVEGVGMRDNASWGFYRLSDVYAHTLSSYNACFWRAARVTTAKRTIISRTWTPSSRL